MIKRGGWTHAAHMQLVMWVGPLWSAAHLIHHPPVWVWSGMRETAQEVDSFDRRSIKNRFDLNSVKRWRWWLVEDSEEAPEVGIGGGGVVE